MSNATPAISMDSSNPFSERKDVCHFCHGIVTLTYPASKGYVNCQVGPNAVVTINGYGPFDVQVENKTTAPQIVNVSIEQPDISLRPTVGGLILRLAFASTVETAVFCSWSCAQEGVQAWVQGVAAEMVQKVLAG